MSERLRRYNSGLKLQISPTDMKQSLQAIGKTLQSAVASHRLWRFSREDAQEIMRQFFFKRIIRARLGADPHAILSCGIHHPSLAMLLGAWQQTLCDALISQSGDSVQSLGKLQRKVSLIEKPLLEYHPGKQYGYVYYWQTETDEMLTTKYLQHMHLLLAWGGEGLFIVSQIPYRMSITGLLKLFREKPKSELNTLTEKIAHSGFSILDVRPVECTFPLVRSAWFDVIVWRILSLFRYYEALSPFVTRVGIHFRKV